MSQWQPKYNPRRHAPATPPQWQQRGYPPSVPPMTSMPPTAAQSGQPQWQQPRHYQPPQPPPYGPPPQRPRKSRKGLIGLGCGGAAGLFVLVAVLASSSPSSSAPPAAQPPAPATAPSPAGSCKLKTTFDYIVRTVEPGSAPQAQEIGNVDLANCASALSDFAATAGQAAGECTTIALASQNPGYNADASPAPPLRHVIQAAGPGC